MKGPDAETEFSDQWIQNELKKSIPREKRLDGTQTGCMITRRRGVGGGGAYPEGGGELHTHQDD